MNSLGLVPTLCAMWDRHHYIYMKKRVNLKHIVRITTGRTYTESMYLDQENGDKGLLYPRAGIRLPSTGAN